MIECPSCGRRQQARLLCANCGTPLTAALDYFSALGLPPQLAQEPLRDLTALERIYHDLSRKIHPDRFASSAPAIRDASLRATALLTRAYRTLRDPAARGLYWLEIRGEKLADNNKAVPPDLAELVFDVQEQLSELRVARDDSIDDSSALLADLTSRRGELQATMDQNLAELQRNFIRWDASEPQAQKMLTFDLKAILSKIAYLRTLMRDVDRALEETRAA